MTCSRCGLAILPGHTDCVNCSRHDGRPVTSVPLGRLWSLAGWSNAAAVGIAGFVLLVFAYAFQPLLGVWVAGAVARSGGREPSVVDGLVAGSVVILAALAFGFAAPSFIVWLYRARRNISAFAYTTPRTPAALAIGAWFMPIANYLLPAFVAADVARQSVTAEARRRRRRLVALVWAWWTSLVLAQVALVVGSIAGSSAELSGLRAEMAEGHTVDVTLTRHLIGLQVIGRLPGAVLYLVAAVLVIMLMHAVNAAQYDRIDAARALLAGTGTGGVPAQRGPSTAADRADPISTSTSTSTPAP